MKFVFGLFRVIGVALLAFPATSFAQHADDEPGDRPDNSAAGLIARYTSNRPDADASRIVDRLEPTPRLVGRSGDSAHYDLPPGGFRAKWSGLLAVPFDGSYHFTSPRSSLADLKLTIGGKEAALGSPVALGRGNVSFQIEGTHAGGAEPRFELWWRSPAFADEPIDPRFFRHSPADEVGAKQLAGRSEQDRGEVLAETMACFRCHEGPADWMGSLVSGVKDPRALLPGPDLDDVGARLQAPWVVSMLAHPNRIDATGRRMPSLFDESPSDDIAARTIAAYLSREDVAPREDEAKFRTTTKGEALVKTAGCLACHTSPKEGVDRDADLTTRVPSLDHLGAKWMRDGLVDFLAQPLKSRPHGRMPDFGLSADQAGDVAAFLLTNDKEKRDPAAALKVDPKPEPIGDDALRSQWDALGGEPAAWERIAPEKRLATVALRQMAARLCLNCHEINPQGEFKLERRISGAAAVAFLDDPTPKAAPPAAPSLIDLAPEQSERGCLSPGSQPRGKAPRFVLNDAERKALLAFTRTLHRDATASSSEAIRIGSAMLNCARCHDDGGRGGQALGVLLGGGDEAKYHSPPTLTRVGERLKPARLAEWTASGARDKALRPWIGARMPGFGERGRVLAEDLSMRDGAIGSPPVVGPGTPSILRPTVRPEHAQLGRFLAGSKALACVNCHSVQGRYLAGSPADPTTRGPDLALVADHLRPEYFRRWMMDPSRVRPETKMPRSFQANGSVPLPDLASLPPDTPMDAIWSYLSQGRNVLPPADEPTILASPAADRPIVQRGVTLAEGSHRYAKGLSLGFADGTLLFDADQLSPVAVWFGGFVKGAPENYFGMAWERSGEAPALLPTQTRPLTFQVSPTEPWRASPLPLESDLNAGSRFEGYQVGKSSIRLHYRLLAGASPVSVVEDVRVEKRLGWEGFSRRLRLIGLPAGARTALAVPSAEVARRLTANGEPADATLDAQIAPLVAYGSAGGKHAVRVVAPVGSAWQDGPRADPEALSLLLAPTTGNAPVDMRMDWWTYRGPNPEPTPAELASLATQAPAMIDHFEDRIAPGTTRPTPPPPLTTVATIATPGAGASRTRPPLTSDLNVDEFAPVQARFVRIMINATNDNNGPAIDELEIYDEDPEINLALWGKASASSTIAGYPEHKVENLNDGQPGNDHGWVGAEQGRGWVQIELPASASLRRVVWARDRLGRSKDRLVAGYRIEVSVDGSTWTEAARGDDRSAINPDASPGYRLEPIPLPFPGCRPSDIAFGPDGVLYAIAMTEGQVWRALTPPPGQPQQIKWTRYASGLNHPIGIAVVDGRLYVSQKPEITELIDRDGDGTVDQFRTVATGWGFSKEGWHEYCFGLAPDGQGHLYFTLTTGKFWTHPNQYVFPGKLRGSIMRVDIETGKIDVVANGCRVPNGVSRGPDGGMFYTDNQGDWIQSCKLAHIVEGRFYGHPETTDVALPEGTFPTGRSSVWLPYQYSRSSSGPVHDETNGAFGPFADQMFVGDVGYGANPGLLRVAFEKVDGEFQGAVFRFVDDQPHGCVRMKFGPDNQLYMASLTTGLTRMRREGPPPFAFRSMTIRPGGIGFVLNLTKPLADGDNPKPEQFRFKRYHFVYSGQYGSPQADETNVPVTKAEVSADRMSIALDLPVETYPIGMVYELNAGALKSAEGETLRHNEAWYTVHRVPKAP